MSRKPPAGAKAAAGKPENLPVRREIIDLPEDQKAGLVRIRDEITQQIEYRPSQFYLLELVRPVYAHPEKNTHRASPRCRRR
jgi:hypothetical protein